MPNQQAMEAQENISTVC